MWNPSADKPGVQKGKNRSIRGIQVPSFASPATHYVAALALLHLFGMQWKHTENQVFRYLRTRKQSPSYR